MKIYIATPVNGRKEKTLAEKRQKAYERICDIKRQLVGRFDNAEFHSSFDDNISPIGKGYYDHFMTESDIMGKCVALVMTCDLVVFDYGWKESKGCTLESQTTIIYGVPSVDVWYFGIGMENNNAKNFGCLANKETIENDDEEEYSAF